MFPDQPLPQAYPPASAIFGGVAILFLVCISLPPKYWSRDTIAFYYQTAKSISTSYDALVDLFDCIGNFLKRLMIHRNFTPGITEIAVKVLAELLSVLGFATKQMQMRRFSESILMKSSVVVQGRLNMEQRSLEENC